VGEKWWAACGEAVLQEVGHEGGVWCVGRALINFSKGFLAVRRRGSFLAFKNESPPGKGDDRTSL
tara:strand:- start:6814 stop:7008 length:195 start_codon:yes stop_codon:yes gene_type:complete